MSAAAAGLRRPSREPARPRRVAGSLAAAAAAGRAKRARAVKIYTPGDLSGKTRTVLPPPPGAPNERARPSDRRSKTGPSRALSGRDPPCSLPRRGAPGVRCAHVCARLRRTRAAHGRAGVRSCASARPRTAYVRAGRVSARRSRLAGALSCASFTLSRVTTAAAAAAAAASSRVNAVVAPVHGAAAAAAAAIGT